MPATFTFRLTFTCFRCGQTITSQDLTQGNCQFVFPENIVQHKDCPLVKTRPDNNAFSPLPPV